MNGRGKKLLALFAKLEEQQQASLMDFAGFLASRPPAGDNSVLKPRPMSRPENETVVQAIRRLTRTFPMLERHKLMNDTSRCMAEYVLRGRPAAEVIIELEMVFAQHYRSAKDKKRKMKAKG